ncbi:MAG TPA: 4-hydroxybenzoate 3-monooxygenase [Candidatus Limnocylindrales bacterium]
MRTQVGIVGAGPAGLVLAHLLHLAGIESVVLEDRSRTHVEGRIRAGVLEQPTVDLLDDAGVSQRLHREGLVHHGIEVRFDGLRHRIALSDLTDGKAITIYGQAELVKDLIAVRIASGEPILFDVEDVRLAGLDTDDPSISFRSGGREEMLTCDYIAGCDGFHGVSRPSIPAGVLRTFERDYPFAWLGILAAVAPSTDELIYAAHDRGFALHSLRSPTISRLYLQVRPDEDIEAWPDDRIWTELRTRLAANDGWTLADGPVLDKAITPLRSFVAEPMQYGRLFLAGDAAHIVPATGAKGLNLAVSDVRALAEAIVARYRTGDESGLAGYTERCLRRVWRVQDFSWWMSSMLHLLPDGDGFGHRLQRAQLDWLVSSESASRSLAENYVGLPFS